MGDIRQTGLVLPTQKMDAANERKQALDSIDLVFRREAPTRSLAPQDRKSTLTT